MFLKSKIVKIHPNAVIPQYHSELAACCDLTLCEDFYIYPGEQKLARTGLIVVPPNGYHWQIYPRSSLCKKHPGLLLANSVGMVDSDYCGPEDELFISIYNANENELFSQPITLKTGQRIAQMRLVQNVNCDFEEITLEELKKDSRGGFGSTGE